MISFLEELEKGTGGEILRNIENGDIILRKPDVGELPEVFHDGLKRREHGEQREFLRNYKTVLCKEGIYKM